MTTTTQGADTRPEMEQSIEDKDVRQEVMSRLDVVLERCRAGNIALRKEHLPFLIGNVQECTDPSDSELAAWGIQRPIIAYGDRRIYVYENFRKLPIDHEHAVTHELAEALLDVGIFDGSSWQEVGTRLDEIEAEDTPYVRTIRRLQESDDASLQQPLREMGLSVDRYRQWLGNRVRHERLAELLTFYLRSGGDREQMLWLRLEQVGDNHLNPDLKGAMDMQNRSEVARLVLGSQQRNDYFFELFHKVLGEQSPEDLGKNLEAAALDKELDDEYDELFGLEIDERIDRIIEGEDLERPRIKPAGQKKGFWNQIKSIFSIS